MRPAPSLYLEMNLTENVNISSYCLLPSQGRTAYFNKIISFTCKSAQLKANFLLLNIKCFFNIQDMLNVLLDVITRFLPISFGYLIKKSGKQEINLSWILTLVGLLRNAAERLFEMFDFVTFLHDISTFFKRNLSSRFCYLHFLLIYWGC